VDFSLEDYAHATNLAGLKEGVVGWMDGEMIVKNAVKGPALDMNATIAAFNEATSH
jgi:hypothetical protein